jgi:peptidoglycan hydrolase CwlO-like protein
LTLWTTSFRRISLIDARWGKTEMKNLDELENKWSELYRKKRELQKEVDRITAEMNKILYEINNLPLDNSEDL